MSIGNNVDFNPCKKTFMFKHNESGRTWIKRKGAMNLRPGFRLIDDEIEFHIVKKRKRKKFDHYDCK